MSTSADVICIISLLMILGVIANWSVSGRVVMLDFYGAMTALFMVTMATNFYVPAIIVVVISIIPVFGEVVKAYFALIINDDKKFINNL